MPSVSVVLPQCSDGLDNDGDTLIDFPADPGCSSAADDNETDAAPSPAPSGGGGGGATYIPPPISVIFKGKAYPGEKVTLLKDAQLAATTVAGPDAKFEVSLSALSSGSYTFGLWAEDSQERRSLIQTFNISITSGTTVTVSGIFLPPTIAIDKLEVRRGEPLTFLGQTAPQADVDVLINSEEEIIKKTVADSDGLWRYVFDTLELDFGNHISQARATLDDDITNLSQSVLFTVGNKTVEAKKPRGIKGDLSGDNRVNLVDFSVLAYWYRRAAPPPSVDLNEDAKIDLVDFSIMAFYWSG